MLLKSSCWLFFLRDTKKTVREAQEGPLPNLGKQLLSFLLYAKLLVSYASHAQQRVYPLKKRANKKILTSKGRDTKKGLPCAAKGVSLIFSGQCLLIEDFNYCFFRVVPLPVSLKRKKDHCFFRVVPLPVSLKKQEEDLNQPFFRFKSSSCILKR